jgi:hypothetical protein
MHFSIKLHTSGVKATHQWRCPSTALIDVFSLPSSLRTWHLWPNFPSFRRKSECPRHLYSEKHQLTTELHFNFRGTANQAPLWRAGVPLWRAGVPLWRAGVPLWRCRHSVAVYEHLQLVAALEAQSITVYNCVSHKLKYF